MSSPLRDSDSSSEYSSPSPVNNNNTNNNDNDNTNNDNTPNPSNSDNKRRRYGDENDDKRRTREDRTEAERELDSESNKTHKDNTNSLPDNNNNNSTSTNSNNNTSNSNYSIEQRILVDNYYVGAIIGRGGSNISKIKESTSCYVNVIKSINDTVKERVVVMKGAEDKKIEKCLILLAKTQIEFDLNKTNNINPNNNNTEIKHSDEVINNATTELKLLFHSHLLGGVIGKNGETIKQTLSETNCNIHVSKDCLPNSTERMIVLKGNLSQLQAAANRIIGQVRSNNKTARDVVPYVPAGSASQYSSSSQYPNTSSNYPLSYGGSSNPPSSTFRSNRPFQFNPVLHIPNYDPTQQQQLNEQKLAIPSVCAGCVLGKQGSTIASLRQQSQCSIVVEKESPETPNERYIIIRGTSTNIQTAIALIRQCVESYKPPENK